MDDQPSEPHPDEAAPPSTPPPGPSRRQWVREFGQVLAWLITLAVVVGYCIKIHIGPRTILGLIAEFWMPVSLIGLILLMIPGRLGGGFGLPGLFRDAPPPPQGWGVTGEISGPLPALLQSGAFLGALGATLLIAQVWTSIYYVDLVYHPGASGFGVSFQSHAELIDFLSWTCPPFLVLVLLAAMFPAPAPGIDRRGRAFVVEVARYAMGIAVGVLLVLGGAEIGGLAHRYLLGPRFMMIVYDALGPLLRVGDTLAENRQAAAMLTTSYGLFLLATWLYLLLLGEVLHRWLSPGLAICLLLGYGLIAYSLVVSLKAVAQLPALGVVAAWLVVCNANPYKYRFPGMDAYRGKPRHLGTLRVDTTPSAFRLLDSRDVLEAWWWRLVGPHAPAEVRDQARAILDALRGDLAPEAREERRARLDALRGRLGPDVARPRLAIVTVTGAAYRSAFWTGVVLDELGRVAPDLPGHIRLMTGASGGMVAAAYYATLAEPNGRPPADVVDHLRDQSRLDSLTPVVRRLLRRDLLRGFWPGPQDVDRGVVLERQWASLDTTFPALREGEQAGWRPSLIVSPMVVETGRRLLFSNLDLAAVTSTVASSGPEPRLYSRPASEFFRVFPDAYPTFRVRTAVRMSATFPYLSPAVSLPTVPPRRVVDAGYYDNYGVDLATNWAYANRDWIARNTSGLALIQVRAYPSEQRRKGYYDPERDAPQGPAGWLMTHLGTAFQWLTTPAEGGTHALAWSMSFRNDGAIRALDDVFNRPGQPRFFETFVFENPLEFAMNWFLSETDIADMARSMGCGRMLTAAAPRDAESKASVDEANLDQKELFRQWWHSPAPTAPGSGGP